MRPSSIYVRSYLWAPASIWTPEGGSSPSSLPRDRGLTWYVPDGVGQPELVEPGDVDEAGDYELRQRGHPSHPDPKTWVGRPHRTGGVVGCRRACWEAVSERFRFASSVASPHSSGRTGDGAYKGTEPWMLSLPKAVTWEEESSHYTGPPRYSYLRLSIKLASVVRRGERGEQAGGPKKSALAPDGFKTSSIPRIINESVDLDR